MLYYYNAEGKFQKESSREYKTEKGAIDKLTKEGRGAVYNEEGQLAMSLVDGQGDEKDAPPRFVRTTCDNLKVRNRPDPNAPVIGYIREAEPGKRDYEVAEEKDGWGRVSVDNLDGPYKRGWIMLAYTKKVD